MLVLAEARPGYVSDMKYLGAILLLQVIVAAIWHFESSFFLFTAMAFLLAGTNTSGYTVGIVVRWLFLGAGAFAGFVKWMKTSREHFGAIHLAALFCVLAALVSAMVSAMPEMALLKVLSLFLLFLYGASGVRLAVWGREASFVNGLVLGCEIAAYASGFFYFVLHYAIFGNPNSLGAVMGVVIVPVLLWSVLVADSRKVKHRRACALLLCGALLYISMCRAGIIAACCTTIILCVALRRQRLLLQGAFFLVLFLGVASVLQPEQSSEFVDSLTTSVLYKGKQEQGILGSRRTPWEQTLSVIQEHPWFGSGFGTSQLGQEASGTEFSRVNTREETGREHGSSYLALLEWVGLLGIVPFITLFLFVSLNIVRVLAWMRRTGSPFHYAIPLAMVLIGSFVHAGFEDWMFAVGYYITLLFWCFAFILADLAPAHERFRVPVPNPWRTPADSQLGTPIAHTR